MKVTEGLKIIEHGWVRKPKGFRVAFHRQTETQIENGFSPPLDAPPLNSDVTAWRYAWKLCQSTGIEAENGDLGALYNITVVDDIGNPFKFYGTGRFETYNQKNIDESS